LIEQLLERKLKKHSGDAHKSLIAAAAAAAEVNAAVEDVREALDDGEVRRSLADLAQPRYQHVSTVGYTPAPEGRSRYALTRVHAKGGIGQVWLARDTDLEREVALKELRPEQASNPTALQRFLREARITGQLDHPGVVPIYEVARGGGDGDGRPFYTMRFIRGRTLSRAVADYHQKREAGEARRVELLALIQAFVGVCQTVAYAHSKGVIHRDLKGQNILLGEFGEVILIDWGLAKLVDQPGDGEAYADDAATGAWPGIGSAAAPGTGTDAGLTVAGQAMGTPAYMAPEQAEGRVERIGRRTDVYGLGAILYEILAGRPPFDGEKTHEVLRKVVEQSADPPRRFNFNAPRALEAVCAKAMRKDPDARYDSAAELAADVQHWIADEPVSAWREPWTARARRWVSRRRTPVAAAAAALVVAVAGLSALLVTQTRANHSLRQALDRESFARDAATLQADLAREAIDSFYTGISEDVILRRPELEELRRRLLGTALSFYEKLYQSLEDPRYGPTLGLSRMSNLARALERLASLQALLGNRDEAIRTRRKVVDVYDKLPGEGPGAAAGALLNLGNLQRMAGLPDDALRSLREALDRYERLNTEGTYEAKVALIRADLGRHLNDIGQSSEALRLLEQARQTQEELVRTARRPINFQQNLAATYVTLGNLYEGEDRLDDALRLYEKSKQIYEELAQSPQDRWDRAELARSLNNVGLARARSGRVDQGRSDVERGLKIREELLADQPLNIECQGDLARSHYHLARVQTLAGTPAEALGSVANAEELSAGVPPKGPEDVYYRACLKAMRAGLVGGGKPEPDLTASDRDDRRNTADEAIARLKQAVASGYRNRTRFEHDSPLDPLRARPDFQELLRSLPVPAPSR
jgi:serine/threonine-protein kinase